MKGLQASWQQAWQRIQRSAMLYGVLGTALRAGAQFFLLPFVLVVLPPKELGIWWLFLSLGTLVVLADFGFGQALTRVYSFLWAGAEDFDTEGLRAPPEKGEPNLKRLRQVHLAAARLYLYLAVGAMTVIGVAGTWLVASHIAQTARPLWNWAAWFTFLVATGYNLATSYWGMACQGVNRVRAYQAAMLWSSLLYFVLAASLLMAGQGLMALVVASAVRAFLARRLWRRAFLEAVPPPAEPVMPDPTLFPRLWPNARRFGVTFIGSYLLTNGNILIGSQILPEAEFASLGLSTQVGFFLVGLANLWLNVKWPEITIMRTQGRMEELTRLFTRRLALMLLTLLGLAALVLIAGNALLAFKGTQTRLLPAPMLAFYFASLCFQTFYGAFGALTCTANVMPFNRVALLTGLGAMTLSLCLAAPLGLWGMLLAVPLAELAGNGWFYLRQGLRSLPFAPKEILRMALS
jgi:O-antigen/teichoic acid export membrane protein